jgi:hypothetical protein
MSSTFKYHSSVDEVIPWQARYTFPTQATKCNKQTVKLVPKNGSTFNPGDLIRIEFPSDNYLNVLNSCLQFDLQTTITDTTASSGVTWFPFTTDNNDNVTTATYLKGTAGTKGTGSADIATADNAYRGYGFALTTGGNTYYSTIIAHNWTTTVTHEFWLSTPLPVVLTKNTAYNITLIPPYQLQRGGTQNLIKRLRVLYGSLVLEDLQEYKTLVRIFYESGVDPGMAAGSGTILEGLFESHAPRAIPTASEFEAQQRLRLSAAGAAFETGAAGALTNALGGVGNRSGSDQAFLDIMPGIKSTIGDVAAIGDSIVSANGVGYNRKCINLLSGIFTQKKLIPLKWMAAQLVLEITLSTVADSFLTSQSTSTVNYRLSNVNFIAEM